MSSLSSSSMLPNTNSLPDISLSLASGRSGTSSESRGSGVVPETKPESEHNQTNTSPREVGSSLDSPVVGLPLDVPNTATATFGGLSTSEGAVAAVMLVIAGCLLVTRSRLR